MDDWQQKIKNILEPLHNKELVTAAGIIAFLGTAYWVFRRIHLQKSPAIQHIHHIQDNIAKALEASKASLESLLVD